MRIQYKDLEQLNPEVLLQHFVPSEARQASHALSKNLDWSTLLEALAFRCHSVASQNTARQLPLLDDPQWVARRLAETKEIISLYEESDNPPIAEIVDVSEALARAQRSAILDADEMLAIAHNLAVFHEVRKFFKLRANDSPLIWQYIEVVEDAKDLEQRIRATFTADGQIADDASPDLYALRSKSRRLGESLRSKIESKLSDSATQDLLQDSFYTQREGRYVLPIKVQHRNKIPGIVHATSASGQTVFVEPAELVELNNALRLADFETQAEEQRILQSLTIHVAQKVNAIKSNIRRCLYYDLLHASAVLAMDLRANIPDLSDGDIELFNARHPLLQLRQNEDETSPVIPNNIYLTEPAHSLVISGANAGGKTVALKTIGLFALMIRAGMPIPAGASSTIPVFDYIFADVGDDQSISNDTSTFSAHVISLSGALPNARENALFLLDEPFSGTDPEHAAPLVIALMRYLEKQKATVVVTTHFDTVKAFALRNPHSENASVGFDLTLMQPTFKLIMGQPGTSSAFEIAQRHGLPRPLLQSARALYHNSPTSGLESVLADLEKERHKIERQQRELEEKLQKVEKQIEENEKLREKMREKDAKSLGSDFEYAHEQLSRLQSRIKELKKASFQKQVRNDETVQNALDKDITETLNQIQAQKSNVKNLTAPPFVALPPDRLIPGARVHIKSYRQNAVIVERRGQSVTLQMGALQVHTKLEDLGMPVHDAVTNDLPATPKKKHLETFAQPLEINQLIDEQTQMPMEPQTQENTLDLRGLTSDDAQERTEFFLQSLAVREKKMAFIIHGHGTGVLKQHIRHFLSRCPLVAKTRPGNYYEGGDGVTLAWLR